MTTDTTPQYRWVREESGDWHLEVQDEHGWHFCYAWPEGITPPKDSDWDDIQPLEPAP